jgi:RNA polymerase sigma factor (sigma-70 family)
LVGIAINKIRQYWQKQSYEVVVPEEYYIDVSDANGDELTESEEKEALEEVENPEEAEIVNYLDQLGSPYKEVIRSRFLESSSIKDTAAELNLTSANVRVIQHRALAKLKEIIETSNERI